jgi:hypothetical protein
MVKSRGDSGLVPKVTGQMQNCQVCVLFVKSVDHRGRLITAAVVDEKDFEGNAHGSQHAIQPSVEFGDVILLVVKGYNDTDLRALVGF